MSRSIYADKALNQIPRLLGNLDRNEYSPTFGCFHRDYWLDKTSDFPDAVRQFGVHALALVYKFDFPGSMYKGNEKIRRWTIAALEFWCSIQHSDGSFDEFYPYERGWVGPTAFTMYTVCESYELLKDEMEEESRNRVKDSIKKAAYCIAKGESEEDHLANHHAMACLSLWKAYKVLNDDYLLKAYEKAFEVFLTYHYSDEGWSREYDGVDPGYLSATVSFFGKVYKDNHDPRLFEILEQSVAFSSYFVYPNGFYAGSLGSRNTLHFYPHGYEILAAELPLARSITYKMLTALGENKLVPPEIISDRYVFYRVPEFLLACLDCNDNLPVSEPLPFEKDKIDLFFDRSKIFVHSDQEIHLIANLAKGGVIKAFDKKSGELIYNDCGIIGKLTNGKTITSQWIDVTYEINANENGWKVKGHFNVVPSNKLFTPLKNIIFRTILLLTGWHSGLAHLIKGQIRRSLILGQRHIPVSFIRQVEIGKKITVYNRIKIYEKKFKFTSLSIGDEFFVRYVPQSRYFQSQELGINGWKASGEDIEKLNRDQLLEKTFEISIR
jgi:hypothetical protein